MKIKWPLMLKSTHEKVHTENYVLRDALKEASAELRKWRLLVAELKTADPKTADVFMRMK